MKKFSHSQLSLLSHSSHMAGTFAVFLAKTVHVYGEFEKFEFGRLVCKTNPPCHDDHFGRNENERTFEGQFGQNCIS